MAIQIIDGVTITNDTEYLSEDIVRLVKPFITPGDVIDVSTLRAHGTPLAKMDVWEWRYASHQQRLGILLPSRRRLDTMTTPLARLADPEWVKLPSGAVWKLADSLTVLKARPSSWHRESMRANASYTAPAGFDLTIRAPNKPRAATARLFTVEEAADALNHARGRLQNCESHFVLQQAQLDQERAEALERHHKRIAMLEKRLQKAERKAARHSRGAQA